MTDHTLLPVRYAAMAGFRCLEEAQVSLHASQSYDMGELDNVWELPGDQFGETGQREG